MAIVGNAGVIKVGGTTVAELKSYSIDTSSDTIEITNMGDASRQYLKGISSFSGSADVFWDATHWTTNNMNPTAGTIGSTGVTLAVYPEGETVGTTDKIITGTILITGYNVKASFDGIIEATISFQGSGALTYATNG